ncbi:MAG: hypothetical protein RID91_16055 [Azospirillaceae bacterium]
MAVSMTVSVRVDGRRVRDLSRLGEAAAGDVKGILDDAILRGARRFRDLLAAEMTRRHSRPWPQGTTDRTLSRRSGALLRDIDANLAVIERGDGADIAWAPSTPYGAIQELGGAVVPRAGKYLAVPLRDALTPRGEKVYRSPRDAENTFVRRSRRGNLIIFQRRPGGDVVPLYVLKSRVYVPARLGLRDAAEDALPAVEQLIAQAVDARLAGGPR